MRRVGRTETGEVHEQRVTIKNIRGEMMTLRRIIVRLDKPTRDAVLVVKALENKLKSSGAAAA